MGLVAETVFLVIMTLTSTGEQWRFNYHKMASMEECKECLKDARSWIPQGGDAEAAVAMYCAKGKANIIPTEK